MHRLKAEIIKHGIITARPDQMYGWPGITRASGQEILVAASERKYHICPFGREVVIRSMDGGKTWGLPQEVYNSELDDRDSNLLTMPDGTLVLTWFTSNAFEHEMRPEWKPRCDRITQRMRDELIATWLLRSYDKGHTWETTPHRLPVGRHAGPTLLSDGSLIYIGCQRDNNNDDHMLVYSSQDQETWNKIGEVPAFRLDLGRKVLLINENHVLEIAPGRLLTVFRCEQFSGPNHYRDKQYHYEGGLYQSVSEDNGKTWTEATPLPMWGYPPHLIRLQSKAILCAYSHRHEPYSIRAVLSYDDGKTWDVDNIITLHQWAKHPDMGYPVSLEIEQGEILTVFYCSRQGFTYKTGQPWEDEAGKKGSTPEGLLFTRWRLT